MHRDLERYLGNEANIGRVLAAERAGYTRHASELARTSVKRIVMSAYCHGLIPARVVTKVFSLLKLRSV